MNPSDPLAQLHPLREPPAIGWWPPAPGWWIGLALVLIGLAGLGWLAYRRWRSNRYRRRALRQLESLRQELAAEPDSQRYAAAVNALLKAAALEAYPRQQVAALSGQEWIEFLNTGSGCTRSPGFQATFTAAIYSAARNDLDRTAVQSAATNWIRWHRAAP